jgi:hypothetical protein
MVVACPGSASALAVRAHTIFSKVFYCTNDSSESMSVTDSTIWIDLHRGNILPQAVKLPIGWMVPDLVINLELIYPDGQQLVSMLGTEVAVVELTGNEVRLTRELAGKYTKPSHVDLASLAVAKTRSLVLLTGDKNLRAAAEAEGVEVHGTLWILDRLVETTILTKQAARRALVRIVEDRGRFPREEISRRLKAWE